VDLRTTKLLDALGHPGAAIVTELLQGEATEAVISTAVGGPQATVHRRLRRFEDLGLVTRPPGAWRSPNRVYSLVVPDEIGELLRSAIAVSAALAEREDAARAASLADLNRNRSSGRHLRRVK
jgi:DNA-binding transcriptional ArsR family regulator